MHCTCIACVTIDSVVKMDKKNYPQVYLEECKYKIKKIHVSRFINTELESEAELESESESETELMAKLKSDFDFDKTFYIPDLFNNLLFTLLRCIV